MSRSPVVTRRARPEDVPVLAGLVTELRELGGRAVRTVEPPSAPSVEQRLARLVEHPDCCVLVAVLDGELVGMTVLSVAVLDPLAETRVVHVTNAVVRGGVRRRGVGRALLVAATGYAEERGTDHLVASVYPGLREAHRFYARLGFAPLVTRRIASVPVLRRRLTAPEQRGLTQELVRRRSRLLRRLPQPLDPELDLEVDLE